MENIWVIKNSKADIEKISKENFITKIIAKMLANRGMLEEYQINEFLNYSEDGFYDPFLMSDMEKGASRMMEAIKMGEKVMIYGDYDVDGVMSTSLLYLGLKKLGAKVSYFIPDREKDGYGLNKDCIKTIADEGYSLIITCDNGISALDEVEFGVENGVDIIITDHHSIIMDGEQMILPKAHAVINPSRIDSNYPNRKICGAGVAYNFLVALFIMLKKDVRLLFELRTLVGIATVCDVVDLVSENRLFVKYALKSLNNNCTNLGLRTIIREANLSNKPISAETLGFVIGPIINSSGRLRHASRAVELLTTTNEATAIDIARELFELNIKRKEMTREAVEDTLDIIKSNNLENDKVLVVKNENIHESLAGIVAGRVKEIYNKPTIILTKSGDVLKGSARSVEAYDMYNNLYLNRDLFLKFGGHYMAAGMSLEFENYEKLRSVLNRECTLLDKDLVKKIYIDCAFDIKNLSSEFLYDISRLEPFGSANPKPLLGSKRVELLDIKSLGEEGRVAKFTFKIGNSNIEGILFQGLEELVNSIKNLFGEEYGEVTGSDRCRIISIPKDVLLDIVYFPTFNDYNNEIQIMIEDYRISK